MKRFLAVLLSMMLLLGLIPACAEETGNTLLATVNGEEIHTSDLQYFVDYYMSMFEYYGYDTTDAALLKEIRSMAMDTQIEVTLLKQQAEATGITAAVEADREELEAAAREEWESIVSSYEASYYGISDASSEEEKLSARLEVLALLESNYGYTEATYVEESVSNVIIERMEAALAEDVVITDDDIRTEFDAHVEEDRASYADNVPMYEYYTQYYGETSYYVPEGYRGITHILLNVDQELLDTYEELTAAFEEQNNEAEATDATAETAETAAEPVTEEQIAAAKQAVLDSVQPVVDEIMAKFNAGTPFEDLIAEYGNDPGMTAEPNRSQGYSVHSESILWDPAFTEGAFSMEKVGDISAPVVGSYGVHILYYLRDVPGGAVEMTPDIRSEIYDTLVSARENDIVTATLAEWKAAAEIVYTEAGLDYQPVEE